MPQAGFAAQRLPLRESARAAWLYGLPLISIANGRQRSLAARNSPGVNRFAHERGLAPAGASGAPNNDTLYSNAWLDLSRGPVVLTIPASGDRYLSVAILNMYSVNDAVLGVRANGPGGGRFVIAGPGHAVRARNLVRLSTPHAWVTARILVDGPSDLGAVHALQDGLGLEGPAGMIYAPVAATRGSPAADYFASLANLIRADPPPPQDAEFFRSIGALGLTPEGGFDRSRFSAEDIGELQAGVDEARAFAAKGIPGEAIQGWTYGPPHHGLFGSDYRLRGATAFSGLGALPQAEAMYMGAVGDQGRLLTGAGPYRLRFENGRLPPVGAFWSLTLYGAAPDGQLYLVDNPLQRFAIGDRTKGLRTNADGSLDIWIARADPGPDRRSNWLPAPPDRPFALMFRAYLPKAALLDGRYRLPPLERT
jgi:hypothetical protein